MNKNRRDITSFLKKVEEILKINSNQSIKLLETISSLSSEDKNRNKEIIESLFNYKKCNTCNIISATEKCNNCEFGDGSTKLLIFEKYDDFIKINLDFIDYDYRYFNLDFNRKDDFLNFDKMKNSFSKIKEILLKFKNIKEIRLIMIPNYEVKILAESLKKEFKDIDVKILSVGVSLNSNINYIDEESMRKAFEKSEEI